MVYQKILFLPVILFGMSLCSCKQKAKNPHQYVIDSKLIESIENIKNLNNHDLYYMDYLSDYKLDKLMQEDLGGSLTGLIYFINHELLNGELPFSSFKESEFACSAFAVKDNDGNRLYARNYDNKSDLSPFVVKTSPKNGYKSINLIDTSFVGLKKGYIDDKKTDLSILAAAPYLVMDGMNEKGLAMSILVVPTPITYQHDDNKLSLITTAAVRFILDTCQNIDEAKLALATFNMHSPIIFNSTYHFLISDASGKSIVLEYIKKDATSEVCTEISFVDDVAVTNYHLTPSMQEEDPWGLDRYNIIKKFIVCNSC